VNSPFQTGSVGVNGTPIFDISMLATSILPDDQPHDLLIRNEVLGDALAQAFRNDSQVYAYSSSRKGSN
jgi:hypothetical protein